MVDRIDRSRGGSFWTRRSTLAAMVAVGATATVRPGPAAGRATGGIAAEAAGALRGICAAVAATPAPARLGALLAEGRDLATVEAALLERLEPAETEAEWRASLLARGRQDVAQDDMVEIEGLRMMRTEAEVLALGSLLRGASGLA